MDELIKLVTEKAGISDEQATAAVKTALDFLKQKLPAPIAAQIDSLLAGGSGATSSVASVAKGLGGLFGKK